MGNLSSNLDSFSRGDDMTCSYVSLTVAFLAMLLQWARWKKNVLFMQNAMPGQLHSRALLLRDDLESQHKLHC